MFSVLWVFLQSAAFHIWYAALHLETGSFPRPLRPAEERQAFAEMQAGNRAARDRLINHNLRLVAHVAKKYYAAAGSQEDLVSIGTIGLIKAVDSFDPARRVRFASFASQCIENAILPQTHFPPVARRRGARRPGFAYIREHKAKVRPAESGRPDLRGALPDDVDAFMRLPPMEAGRRQRIVYNSHISPLY